MTHLSYFQSYKVYDTLKYSFTFYFPSYYVYCISANSTTSHWGVKLYQLNMYMAYQFG